MGGAGILPLNYARQWGFALLKQTRLLYLSHRLGYNGLSGDRRDYNRSGAMSKKRQRVPKLKFTSWRDIGWHVCYRDPTTRTPRKHRFNIGERSREADAKALYHAWVVEHLGGQNPNGHPTQAKLPAKTRNGADVLSGSLLEIGSALIESERSRSRKGGDPRRRGTIAAPVFRDRKKQIRDFLEFLNEQHGPGAVARMRLADLSMEDGRQQATQQSPARTPGGFPPCRTCRGKCHGHGCGQGRGHWACAGGT